MSSNNGTSSGATALEDRIDFAISRHRVLSQLSAQARPEFAAAAILGDYGAGEMLLPEQGMARPIWALLDGVVKVTGQPAGGSPAQILDLVLAGELCGSIPYAPSPPFSRVAIALENSTCLCFPEEALLRASDESAALGPALAGSVSRQFERCLRLRGTHAGSVEVRVARALVYLHDRFGPLIRQPRAIVAGLAATSTESAIRATVKLRRAGLIRTGRNFIEVVALPELLGVAYGSAGMDTLPTSQGALSYLPS